MVRLRDHGPFCKYGCRLFVCQPDHKNNSSIHLRELEIFALFTRVFLLLANTMVPIFINSEIRLILFQIIFSLPWMWVELRRKPVRFLWNEAKSWNNMILELSFWFPEQVFLWFKVVQICVVVLCGIKLWPKVVSSYLSLSLSFGKGSKF